MEKSTRLLYPHRIGCLPIMENGRLVGLSRRRTCCARPGSRSTRAGLSGGLEVRMPTRELARVVRLIGIEKRVNIGGIVVPL